MFCWGGALYAAAAATQGDRSGLHCRPASHGRYIIIIDRTTIFVFSVLAFWKHLACSLRLPAYETVYVPGSDMQHVSLGTVSMLFCRLVVMSYVSCVVVKKTTGAVGAFFKCNL